MKAPSTVKGKARTVIVSRRAADGHVWFELRTGAELPNAGPSGMVPGEWSELHQAQAEALANGESYVPKVKAFGADLTHEQLIERRLETLENGSNATLDVPAFTRWCAANEARQGGVFRGTLNWHTAEQWPVFARELFASLFEGAAELPDTERPKGTDWISAALDKVRASQDWEKLRKLADGDAWSSGVASNEMVNSLGKTLRELLDKLPPEDPQRLDDEAQGLDELLGSDHPLTVNAQRAAMLADDKQAEVTANIIESDKLATAIDLALETATETLEGIQGQVDGFGAGKSLGAGGLVNATPAAVREALARNPTLREIAKQAGRIRVAARRVKREKVKYLPEQVVDLTLGGEISRLVPSELVQLANPTTKLNLLRRLGEQQAMTYQLEGTESLEQGPVIVAIDASSSMQGARYQWAMGVAMALIESALKAKRPFRLFSFHVRVNEVFSVERPSDLTIGLLEEMLCNSFSGGGTNIGAAIQEAAKLATEKPVWKRSDLVLVTDGDDTGWGAEVATLKETVGLNTYGIAVGRKFKPAEIEALAGLAQVTDLELREERANVDVVFGI